VAVVVLTVKVEVAVPLAGGVTEVGERPQVTVAFTGAIAQVNPTAELKPYWDAAEMVEEVLFPTTVIAEAGEAEMVKPLTVSVSVAVWVKEPEVPVTVVV
jgi:hypothetical protein